MCANRTIKLKCPQCGAALAWTDEFPFRPFCSERCKNLDLGAWAEERYAIAGAPPEPGGGTQDVGED